MEQEVNRDKSAETSVKSLCGVWIPKSLVLVSLCLQVFNRKHSTEKFTGGYENHSGYRVKSASYRNTNSR